jgi:serine/threonine-protein kinase
MIDAPGVSRERKKLLLQQLGKYQLVRKLAVGGMAEVFLAKAAGPMGFEKTLVLKRILPDLAGDPVFVRMFLAEAKLAASLNHPNIAQIFDFGQEQGAYFIAMEYVDGPNLRSLSRRSAERSIPIPVSLCAKIISSACEALAYAHEFIDPGTATPLSVIHRDVSPENILLSRTGAVKMVDFGIAKAAGRAQPTESGILRGKISYMPPEQIQGKEIDHRADIFALGVVFYELITGSKPFDARSDVTIVQAILYEQMIPAIARRPDIPEPIARMLQRALAKDPDGRYPTCRHFQVELEHFIVSTGEPVGAYQLAALVSRLGGASMTIAAPPSVAPVAVGAPPAPGNELARAAVAGGSKPPDSSVQEPRTLAEAAARQPLPEKGPLAILRRRGKYFRATVGGLLGAAMVIAAAGIMVLFRTPAPSEPIVASPADRLSPEGGDNGTQQIAVAVGRIDFQVQPYATVFLDGKLLGQTPFPPVQVYEGKHSVRLVNADLKKEVTVEYVVKPGEENIFQYTLSRAEN